MLSPEFLRPYASNLSRKQLGKLASRLEELKNPWRPSSSTELSHSEAARLATDALLESGEQAYLQVLQEEKELPFLSPLEIQYIADNGKKNAANMESGANGMANMEELQDGDAMSEQTSGTYFPLMSDMDPPVLELGWPEIPHLTRIASTDAQIYFHRDRTKNIKDLFRSLIKKAKNLIAIVMDLFTDIDILCDLIEAASKRRISVYLLLDEINLQYFTELCDKVDIRGINLANMRIRSVHGDTYCTKSGKKFIGQIFENFMIVDCEQVVVGSYSFTWLSGQVHSHMVIHFTGKIVEDFDREFRCLYADSKIIDFFDNPENELPVFFSSNILSCQPAIMTEQTIECEPSEHSSSLSDSSVSSIKKGPFLSTPAFKVLQERRGTNPNYIIQGKKVTSPNHVNQEKEGTNTPYNNPSNTEQLAFGVQKYRSTFTRMFSQLKPSGLGLCEPNQYSVQKNTYSGIDHQVKNLQQETDTPAKQRGVFFLHKMSDALYSVYKERDGPAFFRNTPQNKNIHSKETDVAEVENKSTVPFYSGIEAVVMREKNHRITDDEKRMTLGHSKLELVREYNKLANRHIYSRYELVKKDS
ncbi:protein FAM83C [Latimeria chalumnae]|uniref:protein FAM83C n=1 Tax=Latimeria chalumnae TaxID=7897 RepID=UPI0003C14C08|nr:PREDICTED: protein FAM83C [Latimeria chalumnae]|eukprot:XP_006007745.1 PREDICTED: protein FAM83C [Latimeria chalumnae]